MRRLAYLLALIALVTIHLSVSSDGQEADQPVPPMPMNVPVSSEDALTVAVPIRDGHVSWREVSNALAGQLKLDAPTLAAMFPPGDLDLRSGSAMLTLLTINLTMSDLMSLQIASNDDGARALVIRCKRRLLSDTQVALPKSSPIDIDADADWKLRAGGPPNARRPLVVFLHGIKSDGKSFDGLRELLRGEGFATAAATYDYSQSISASAAQMSRAINDFMADGSAGDNERERRIAVVGHSMGGLVAREWAENPALNNNRIEKLITLGTPHQGSAWATLPPLLDMVSGEPMDGDDLVNLLMHQPSDAGLQDLAPNSDFLKQLNSRPRRADIQYSSVVGTRSPMTAESYREMQRMLRSLDQEGSVMRLIRPRLAPLLEDRFPELESGQGDGIVSIKSATLPDVKDTIQVDVSHFDMVGPAGGGKPNPVWEIVLDRLQR